MKSHYILLTLCVVKYARPFFFPLNSAMWPGISNDISTPSEKIKILKKMIMNIYMFCYIFIIKATWYFRFNIK